MALGCSFISFWHPFRLFFDMKRLILIAGLLLALPFAVRSQSGEAGLADQYFEDGEYQNALDLYLKLNKETPEVDIYILRGTACFTFLGQYAEGVKFLDKVVRTRPGYPVFSLMKADMLTLNGQSKEADELVKETIDKKLISERDFLSVGNYLAQAGKTSQSLECFLKGRKVLKSQTLFSGEIAQLYRAQKEYANATRELLNLYYSQEAGMEEVSIEILNLLSTESKPAVEEVLLAESQKHQLDRGLRQFLYEFYLQTEDFMEAFVQVKSMVKAFPEEGDGTLVYDFAMTMRNNKQYRMSNKALDYLIENHRGTQYYFQSFQDKTVNSELEAFETLPIDTNAIRMAVNSYNDLLDQYGRTPQFFDAMYRKARLCAFYLFDLDAATAELEEVVNLPVDEKQRGEANLLLGDVLLMQKEFDKAKLKYSEVAAKFKDGQIGAMAKFREGRLSYFKGDFEIAKARLTSIKDNTSNDISNDAIKLFLTIVDNTGTDTITRPLEIFSQAQLLIFQRDFDPAIELMDSLMFEFPGHNLADEVLWEKANIDIQRNQIDKALIQLDKIITDHSEDILADDALFTKAKIYDYHFKNKEKAQEFYIEFLKHYPGSLYIVEVRKRIRELRVM
jgi:tetratricopeptide (TPR) repeat protein